jgi:riboflavin transporter FmnP
MVELEENVMINASFLPAVLAEMVSNLEPNQVILEEKKLLHFIRMKIKKKWISIPMKLLSSTS